ncbi:MAG: DNA replication/repair protein RecF [Clostridia bacterium]|nr:DNA replication/repair protein RecF [Clostridia bacterium]
MICKKITVENFRNIESAEVSFSDGVNVIYGNNAQGKTNLLEAVCMFSLGKSFRGVKENEFIRFDSQDTSLGMDYSDRFRSQDLRIYFDRSHQRYISHNGIKLLKLSELIGRFRAVLFVPEHLNVIKEGPSMRRSYLDVAISQLRPAYLKSLQRYNHILAQRNKLIKSAGGNRKNFDATVEFWSYQLASEASAIVRSRVKYLALVSKELERSFSDMTGDREKPSLAYDFSFRTDTDDVDDREKITEAFFSQLMSNHDREIASGATMWGVHKDDVNVMLNGKSARMYASQGQQRSLALGLKLAESSISMKDTGEWPVLLLDDVFSELDAERREYLTERMKTGQVIMTACGDPVAADSAARVIRAESGRFYEDENKEKSL